MNSILLQHIVFLQEVLLNQTDQKLIKTLFYSALYHLFKANVGDFSQCTKKGNKYFWKRLDFEPETAVTGEIPEVPDSITTKNLRMENGEAFEQTTVFYPKSGETKVLVPAHGSNAALMIIFSKYKMVHVHPYFCQIRGCSPMTSRQTPPTQLFI